MYTPPKLKYAPDQLYKSDINDLVEEEIMSKGGKGSGVKGHKTAKKEAFRSRQKGESLPKYIAEHLEHHGVKVHGVHHADDPSVEDHYVDVGDGLHVQIPSLGDNYMHVVQEHSDDSFSFHPERLKVEEVVSDIQRLKNKNEANKPKLNPDISLEAKKEKVANAKWRKERLPNRK